MKKVLGIDIGGTNLRGAIVNERGDISHRSDIKSGAKKGINVLMKNLLSFIDKYKDFEPLAVGIGIPGIIDSKKGVLTQAPNIHGVHDFQIYEELNKHLYNLPFVLDNDANCLAAGEFWLGSLSNSNSLIMLTLGTGLGGGIILDGNIWHGEDGMAGEIGHIVIDPNGPECNCGSHGCFESFVSAEAIRRNVKNSDTLREKCQGTEKDLIPEKIMELALSGDTESMNIWKEIGKYLGIGTASLINLLNVDSIVIGGGISNAWDLFNESMFVELEARALRGPLQRVKIVKSGLGNDAGILGAAYLAMKKSDLFN